MPVFAEGERVCGGKVGAGVVGSIREVGDTVGFFDGRGVGSGVDVHFTLVSKLQSNNSSSNNVPGRQSKMGEISLPSLHMKYVVQPGPGM